MGLASARPTLPLEFLDLRRRHLLQQPVDHVFGGHAFGLGLEVGADAVAEDGDGDFADVVDGDAEAAFHRG